MGTTTAASSMLAKGKCYEAVMKWQSIKKDYSKVNKLINPEGVFGFTSDDCAWLIKNNDNTNFCAYVGVYNSELILIIYPLDKSGEIVVLDEYVISPITTLTSELVLIEKSITETVKRTVLSEDLQITSKTKEIKESVENWPSINTSVALNEILSWKNQCLQWFYYECANYGGERIFNRFMVPLVDMLSRCGEETDVVCLLGLKPDTIYQRALPELLFVDVNEQFEIEVKDDDDSGSGSNTNNFPSPCPPFCIQDILPPGW